jgi:hypothetical protein
VGKTAFSNKFRINFLRKPFDISFLVQRGCRIAPVSDHDYFQTFVLNYLKLLLVGIGTVVPGFDPITRKSIECTLSKVINSLLCPLSFDFLLKNEYNIRKAFSDFSIDLAVWPANVSLLSRVTPKYFISVDHGIERLSTLIWAVGGFLGDQHRVKYISWVLAALIFIFHCLNYVERESRCRCSKLQTTPGSPLDTKIAVSLSLHWGESAVKKLYREGDNMAPCRTP